MASVGAPSRARPVIASSIDQSMQLLGVGLTGRARIRRVDMLSNVCTKLVNAQHALEASFMQSNRHMGVFAAFECIGNVSISTHTSSLSASMGFPRSC